MKVVSPTPYARRLPKVWKWPLATPVPWPTEVQPCLKQGVISVTLILLQ